MPGIAKDSHRAEAESPDLDAAVTRLAAAAAADNDRRMLEGLAAGEKWVKTMARPRQLEELAYHMSLCDETVASLLARWEAAGSTDGIADGLYGFACPEGGGEAVRRDRGTSARVCAFWAEVLGKDEYEAVKEIEDFHFAFGFLSGALDLWQAIERRVEEADHGARGREHQESLARWASIRDGTLVLPPPQAG